MGISMSMIDRTIMPPTCYKVQKNKAIITMTESDDAPDVPLRQSGGKNPW